MIGGISFQLGYCQHCGQPLYPSLGTMAQQQGHNCPPADPRIMAELKAIKESFDAIRDSLAKLLA